MNPPVPTAIKLIRGNPGKRPINKLEPQPKAFHADPPDHLNEDAISEWNRLVPILKRMRVLTEADYLALAHLCLVTATVTDAVRHLAAEGEVFVMESGYRQVNPYLSIRNKNLALAIVLLREFGLTPSSRGRVKTAAPEKKSENPFAALG